MDCEMCGREEAAVRAAVEGTTLSLCAGCGRYGKVIGNIASAVPAAKRKDGGKQGFAGGETEVVVDNFGRLLKQKREELGRKQEEGFMKLEGFAKMISVKESILHKMETGEYFPSVEEARRIGKVLGLKLVERAEIVEDALPQPKKDQLTLGDMIRVKKK